MTRKDRNPEINPSIAALQYGVFEPFGPDQNEDIISFLASDLRRPFYQYADDGRDSWREMVSFLPDGELLVIGSGSGFSERMIYDERGNNVTIQGIDIKQNAVWAARRITRSNPRYQDARIKFSKGSVLDLSRFGKFDGVLMANVIYHVEDADGPERAIDQIARAMRPNAISVVSSRDNDNLTNLYQLSNHVSKKSKGKPIPPVYSHCDTARTLELVKVHPELEVLYVVRQDTKIYLPQSPEVLAKTGRLEQDSHLLDIREAATVIALGVQSFYPIMAHLEKNPRRDAPRVSARMLGNLSGIGSEIVGSLEDKDSPLPGIKNGRFEDEIHQAFVVFRKLTKAEIEARAIGPLAVITSTRGL